MSYMTTRGRLESLVRDYNEQYRTKLQLGYDENAEMFSIYDPEDPDQEVVGYEDVIEQMLLDWLQR